MYLVSSLVSEAAFSYTIANVLYFLVFVSFGWFFLSFYILLDNLFFFVSADTPLFE